MNTVQRPPQAMSTLYLDRRNLSLELQGGVLVVRRDGAHLRTVPLRLIGRVVARGRVALDTGVLAGLAEAGVGLVALTGRRTRFGGVLVGRPHGDVRLRLAQYRVYLDPAARTRWARRVVAGKLVGARRTLVHLLAARPDRRVVLTRAVARLNQGLARLRRDETHSVETLMGIEGAAAAAYFPGLAAAFPPALGFQGRNRRPPRDPVNACLSLVYTLLHAEAVQAVHAGGLDPMLGFLHEPAFGRESGAADLVELFRGRADLWVWALFRDRVLRADHFRQDGEAVLLGKAGRRIFYSRYELAARHWRRAMRRVLRAAARQLVAEVSP